MTRRWIVGSLDHSFFFFFLFFFYTHCELDEISSSFGSSLIWISSFVVCGGKFSLATGLLYLRMALSNTRAASLAVSNVPRPVSLPSTVILA